MNRKIVSRIVLLVILLSLTLMLASCNFAGSDLSLGLYRLFGGLVLVIVGFISSIFSAIISAILGVVLFIMGIFTTLGGLVGSVLELVVGLF